MNKAWFKKWGWIHYPANVVGFILTLSVLLLIMWIFTLVDRNSHSASDTLLGTFPWALTSLLALSWIASKTSV
jgi:hypothetical protein